MAPRRSVILDPERIGWHKRTTRERFWNKVEILSDDECWTWTGNKFNKREYGAFKLPTGDSSGGVNVLAHKYSYFLKTGYFPLSKEYVCHKCDNPSCVNPSHLFLGTQFDNMQDMVSKGRNVDAKGSKNPNAKVDEEIVFKMRRLYSCGLTGRKIADMFGISQTQTHRILNGENWSTS